MLKLDCVLEEVIFIDIENMGSWKKVEVLKYKAATMEPEKEIFSFKDGASEENKRFKEFIEQYPVIYYDQDNISFKDYGCTNELLNLIELAAILEPYMKSFYLKDILKEISTLEESEKMKKTKQMVIALNCLLSRLWIREENVPLKNRLYEQLKRENIYWIWQKYLISPPLFSTELYNYIKLEGKRESVNKRIDHKALSSYELLLRNEELWSSEGFKYVYRPEQENISKKIRENFQKGERIFIEAPTGSGKSFAYILTAAICSYENSRNKNKEGSNFIISTDTKELQNQLIEKDIPKLLKTLNLHNTVKYGSIKGKKNYLCIERLRKCEKIQGKLVYIFLKRLVENGEYGDIENINYWAYSYFEIEKYLDEVVPALTEKFNYTSVMAVPKVDKIVLNMGVGDAVSNAKNLEKAAAELALISGQKPLITKAKKSIAGFRLREGVAIGAKVTLRGQRMYEFLDKLVTVSLPRVRDFHGVPTKSFDGRGNYTLGVKEQLIFPEINFDNVDKVRGLDIVIVTTANTDEESRELLTGLGMPFAK